MATAYAYLVLSAHTSNLSAGVREFEPRSQLVSVAPHGVNRS